MRTLLRLPGLLPVNRRSIKPGALGFWPWNAIFFMYV